MNNRERELPEWGSVLLGHAPTGPIGIQGMSSWSRLVYLLRFDETFLCFHSVGKALRNLLQVEFAISCEALERAVSELIFLGSGLCSRLRCLWLGFKLGSHLRP